MIDFRYHIVSLTAVFLALAVGIVLGSGPLQQAIGDAVTDESATLRAELDQARAELETARAATAIAEDRFAAAVPGLVDGVLGERRVALVLLDDVAPETVESVTALLAQAGGAVTTTVRVTADWTDPAKSAFRRSLAGTVAGYLDPPAATEEAGDRLAEALIHGLVTPAPGTADELDADAAMILELLRSSELVEVTTPDRPADAVVVLAGNATEAGEETRAVVDLTLAQLGAAAQARSGGAVVGGDGAEGTPLASLRAGGTDLSTVDSIETLAGQASVPLALAARIAGTAGHYGTRPGAEATLPGRVALDVVVRVPREAPVDPDTPTEEPDTPEGEAPAGENTD